MQNLGVAVTAHRAQGVTPDTAHAVVTANTTRENFYRDRYQITDDRIPFGPPPDSTSHKIDAARARAALNRAQSIAHEAAATAQSVRPAVPARSGPSS